MEEAKAYIETGILELYVLGQLDAVEQAKVEEMAFRFPLVKEELKAIETALEKYALNHAVQPSADLESKVNASIANLSMHEEDAVDAAVQTEDHVIVKPLYPDSSVKTIRLLKYSLAACFGLLIISVVALYSAHNNLSAAKQQIVALNQDQQKFAATVSFMKTENEDLKQMAVMASDPSWTAVKLAGTKIAPDAKLVVYWNKKDQNVVIDNSKMALPINDEGHQYQLWALVNGKPVDLGVFDAKEGAKKVLVSMKEIGAAEAFAVTLEKRGGSPSPTMEKMVAMGGISI